MASPSPEPTPVGETTTVRSRQRFISVALAFEGGLGVVAAAAGWLVGRWPWETLHNLTLVEWAVGCGWGVLATVPLVAALLCIHRWPVGPFAKMKRFVHHQLVPMFANLSLGELGLLALAAGVGEELLFRGLLQAHISSLIGPPYGWLVGLLVASIIFGICHWLTAFYAALATLVAIYLGGLFLLTENLLAPIIVHALYDFIALVYLVSKREREPPPADSREPSQV